MSEISIFSHKFVTQRRIYTWMEFFLLFTIPKTLKKYEILNFFFDIQAYEWRLLENLLFFFSQCAQLTVKLNGKTFWLMKQAANRICLEGFFCKKYNPQDWISFPKHSLAPCWQVKFQVPSLSFSCCNLKDKLFWWNKKIHTTFIHYSLIGIRVSSIQYILI